MSAPDQGWIKISWSALRSRRTKIAFSIKELVQLTSDFSTKNAVNCRSSVVRTDPPKFLLVYKVTCSQKDRNGKNISDPSGHLVRIKFDPARITDKQTADQLDVQLSCDCKAFVFWGPQWNLSEGDALYGKPKPLLQAPTDPERFKHIICKHIAVVADRVAPVVERMLGRHRTVQDQQKLEEEQKRILEVKKDTEEKVEEAKKDQEKKEEKKPEAAPPAKKEPAAAPPEESK